MDAAIAEEAEKMQAMLPSVLHQVEEQRVLEEVAPQDGRVDAGNFLVDDASGADVQVSDFGIAHQSVRQADAFAGSVNESPGILLEELGVVRRARQRDGV